MAYTVSEYQQDALRTINADVDMTFANEHPQLVNAALGLCGEAGEFADMVKKAAFQGEPFDILKASKEVGDVLWYVSLACYALNIPMEDIAKWNIAKLKKRFPEGFDADRSVNRVKYGVTDEQMEAEKKYAELMKTKIEELDLSARAYSALKYSGVKTIQDMIGWTKERFENSKRIGKKSQEEIIDRLEEVGVKYVDGTLTWRPENDD